MPTDCTVGPHGHSDVQSLHAKKGSPLNGEEKQNSKNSYTPGCEAGWQEKQIKAK